jgi:hypothetical protein
MKSSYKLEIDPTLWRAFKIKCATQGKTMLSVIISLIEKYVNQK